jgi:hypothetical protein
MGCSLIPKKVEFFQRKVRAYPEVSDSAKETQRQAADYVASKTEEIKVEAIEAGTTNIAASATEANVVAEALSGSLGPPEDLWKKEAQRLALKLKEQQADFNEQLESYKKHIDKDAGKKIEGTGFIQLGYFTYIGLLLGLGALVWFGLKIYGSINPVVGLGTNVVGRLSSSVLSKGYSEIVEGGEAFKTYLANSGLAAEVKDKVLDLFSRAHKENQSRDTQAVISTLTK